MKQTCKKCGHEWEARVKSPVCCPRCKRADWQKPVSSKQKSEIINDAFDMGVGTVNADLLDACKGMSDALKEAAKMLRSLDCQGHAAVCDVHTEKGKQAIERAEKG